MLTGDIRGQIDRIWDAFWSGGIANPLEVIEQITYLLFLRRLDELHTVEELKATRLKKPIARRIFPAGKDDKGWPYEHLRWSVFRNAEPRDMYAVVSERVFPWLRAMGGDDSTYAHHMKDARFTIPTPALLAKVVAMLDRVPMEDRDTDAYWQGITVPMLDRMRKRLRALVKLIDKTQRPPVYTEFPDQLGEGAEIVLPGFAGGTDIERFREKARHFLKQHEAHLTIQKLRRNQPLTASDVRELERMLLDAGVGTAEDIERAQAESEGLGLFVRALVGLDREAAKQALNAFLLGKTLNADQIEVVTMVIDHLTANGAMKPELLYESPYTDFDSRGVDGVFPSAQVTELIAVLEDVRKRAAA